MTAWPDGWHAASDTDRGLEAELRREVGAGHILEGLTVRLIARRFDRDDAVFALDDGRVVEVHLTWRGSAEIDPNWPSTTIFEGLIEWRKCHDQTS